MAASLKIREATLGDEHVKVAETLNSLALLYMSWDRTRRCERLFQRAVAIYEKALGENHTAVATVLRNMVVYYRKVGKAEKAAAAEERARSILSRKGSRSREDTL